jgi:cobalt-zinc-cadmium efflux system protein
MTGHDHDDHSHDDHDGHSHAGHSHADHDHHGHGSGHGAHNHAAHASRTRLGWAAGITAAFLLVEIAGGLISGSLALLADAGHMFTDAGGLALAWFAAGLALRPADRLRSYGFDRFAVLVAFGNGLSLFGIAGLIIFEAVQRLMLPAEVMGLPMLVIAAAGLVVNIIAFFILHGGPTSLNMRGAVLHVLGDMLGSAAAILAALVILATGWSMIDPILSVLVAVLILRSAWGLVRDSGQILLEAAPANLDSKALAADLMAHIEGVRDVHHVHVWSITEERRMATLHARIVDATRADEIVLAIKMRLLEAFGIDHATVEVELSGCSDKLKAA